MVGVLRALWADAGITHQPARIWPWWSRDPRRRKPGSAVSWQPCRPWHGAGALWSWARRSEAGQEGLGAAGTRSYIAFKNLCDLSGSCSCSSKNLLFFLVYFLFCRLSPTAANLHFFFTYEGSVISRYAQLTGTQSWRRCAWSRGSDLRWVVGEHRRDSWWYFTLIYYFSGESFRSFPGY